MAPRMVETIPVTVGDHRAARKRPFKDQPLRIYHNQT